MKISKKILVSVVAAVMCASAASVALVGCNSSNGGGEVVTSEYQQTENNSSQEAQSEAQSQQTVELKNGEMNAENGLVLVQQDGHWRGLELFGGGTGETFSKAVNSLRSKVNSDVKIWVMPDPLASEYYTPQEYSEYSASQEQFFNDVKGKMDNGITFINVAPVLRQHIAEDIYLRTDHHWTALGAYYAAQAFANEAGVQFGDLEQDYTKLQTDKFVGTLYSQSGDQRLLNDPEAFVYYKPKKNNDAIYFSQTFTDPLEGAVVCENVAADELNSNEYMRFIGGDAYVVKVNTDVNNGRKLLVIKDSYGNALIPFLVNSFQEIYVVDMRYFECSTADFVKDFGITDVLISCASYSLEGANASGLDKIINSNTTKADPKNNQSSVAANEFYRGSSTATSEATSSTEVSSTAEASSSQPAESNGGASSSVW